MRTSLLLRQVVGSQQKATSHNVHDTMHGTMLNGMQPVGMTQEGQVMKVRIGHADHEQSDESQRADPRLFMRHVIDDSRQTTDGQDKKESELVSQMMKEFQLCGAQIEESQ